MIAILVSLVALAGDGSGKVIPWDDPSHDRDLVGLMNQLEGIYPPPPAVEAVELGTFDCATGLFTWSPRMNRRESGVDQHYDDVRVGTLFEEHGIEPFHVDLDPAITIPIDAQGAITDVNFGGGPGGAVGSGATAGGAPPARPRPAAPAGDARTKPGPSSKVPATVPNVDVAQGDRPWVGNPLGKWLYFVRVRAGKVDLVVRATNRPAGVPLQLTAESATSSADADVVERLVPPRVYTRFKITCGAVSYEDNLLFDRPPQLGIFSLEAFPVTVVYEPPGPGSEQRYETAKQVGTTLRSFERSSSSVEEPVSTAFTQADEFIGIVGKVGGAVANAYPAVGAAIQGASSVMAAAWGEADADETVKHEVTKEHGLSVTMRNSETVYTNAGLGPGRGDVIHYLVSPTFAWLAAQDVEKNRVYVTVALLGYRRVADITAEGLRSGSGLGISDATRQMLLAHDVLTPEHAASRKGRNFEGGASGLLGAVGAGSGPYANPSPYRLVPAKDFEREFDAGLELSLERTIEEEDVLASSTTHTVATKESAGFLGFVAKNVPHDADTTISTTHGTSNSTKVSKTIKATAKLVGAVSEPHLVHCWYDKLSGTFAFQDVPYAEDSVSGAMTSSDGAPVSGEEVRLVTQDGLTAVTRTDEQGRFKFRSPLLREGRNELVAGDAKLPIEWKGKSLADQRLQVGRAGDPTVRAPAMDSFTITPDPEIKGRLGRIAVDVPGEGEIADVKIEVFGDDPKALHWSYSSTQTELFPGTYRIAVNGHSIPDVKVERGHVTRLQLGGLRVHAGPETKIELFEPDAEQALTWHYGGPWLVALAPGDYDVRVNGRSERVTIAVGRVDDF